MTKPAKLIIIVDDDKFSNLLSKTVLTKFFIEIEVKCFPVPEVALNYIINQFIPEPKQGKVVLFLDINMPTISGWEFLHCFETFSAAVKDRFIIYMLSSTIDPIDIQRAKEHPLVTDFIEKPLNKVVLEKLFGRG